MSTAALLSTSLSPSSLLAPFCTRASVGQLKHRVCRLPEVGLAMLPSAHLHAVAAAAAGREQPTPSRRATMDQMGSSGLHIRSDHHCTFTSSVVMREPERRGADERQRTAEEQNRTHEQSSATKEHGCLLGLINQPQRDERAAHGGRLTCMVAQLLAHLASPPYARGQRWVAVLRKDLTDCCSGASNLKESTVLSSLLTSCRICVMIASCHISVPLISRGEASWVASSLPSCDRLCCPCTSVPSLCCPDGAFPSCEAGATRTASDPSELLAGATCCRCSCCTETLSSFCHTTSQDGAKVSPSSPYSLTVLRTTEAQPCSFLCVACVVFLW